MDLQRKNKTVFKGGALFCVSLVPILCGCFNCTIDLYWRPGIIFLCIFLFLREMIRDSKNQGRIPKDPQKYKRWKRYQNARYNLETLCLFMILPGFFFTLMMMGPVGSKTWDLENMAVLILIFLLGPSMFVSGIGLRMWSLWGLWHGRIGCGGILIFFSILVWIVQRFKGGFLEWPFLARVGAICLLFIVYFRIFYSKETKELVDNSGDLEKILKKDEAI